MCAIRGSVQGFASLRRPKAPGQRPPCAPDAAAGSSPSGSAERQPVGTVLAGRSVTGLGINSSKERSRRPHERLDRQGV